MVRGAAALLGTQVVALTYFLVAPALPELPAGDTSTLVAGGLGLALVGVCGLAVVLARDEPASLVLFAAGGGLVSSGLAAAGAGPAANSLRALLAGAAGVAFARILDDRRALVAVPLVVAVVDAWSVAGGPSSSLVAQQPRAVDFLTFDLPTWGAAAGRAGQLGLADVVFLAMFATWTLRFGLRPRSTAVALIAALVGALVAGVQLGRAVPVLPLVALAFLAPNADRVWGVLGRPSG